MTRCVFEKVNISRGSFTSYQHDYCLTHEWLGRLTPGHTTCRYQRAENNLTALLANHFGYVLKGAEILPPLPPPTEQQQAPENELVSEINQLLRGI
jgi:hypothetical protein